MAATAGSGSDPVAGFCAALRRLQESSGYEVPVLARQLHMSRSHLYDIVGGNIKRPPDWSKVVRPLVEACTAGDPHEVARWRQDHAVLVRVYEELNRRDRARPGAGGPAGTGPGGQVVVGEIPREPPGFVRREALGELVRAVGRRRVAVVCAVTGLRGVGKTQLAAAYARQRVSEGWGLVAWVTAEDRDSLLAGLARVAGRLGVADPDGDSQESARRLREYLTSRPGPALLVVDNAADPAVLRPFLPAAGRTQVVVTSTDQAFSELGESVAVDTFSRRESLGYLADRTGLADREGAGAVAAELGDLPIALAQAAATIVRRRLTYPGYLGLLHQVPIRDLLGVIRGGDYRHSAAAALLLSAQAAEAGDPAALTGLVLRVIAVLSPQGVRRDLLAGLATGGEYWGRVDDAVERCVAGSLLAWSVSGDAVMMHRLLGRVVRERDQAEGRWPGTVSTALDLLQPWLFHEQQAWDRREDGVQLTAHIEALWAATAAADPGRPDLRLRLLQSRLWAVRQLCAMADFSRAAGYAAQVMADCERILGRDHPVTLTSRYNLAEAWRSAGQLDRAISLHEQALAGREQTLGTRHLDTLASRDALASAYAQAGRTSQAIPLHEQTLAGREQVLGADHPDTLASRDHLGEAHLAARHHDWAIVLFQQTLEGRERVLGTDHPDTLLAR